MPFLQPTTARCSLDGFAACRAVRGVSRCAGRAAASHVDARTGVLRAGFGQCPLESSTCCREGEASEHPAPSGMGTKLPNPSRTLKMPKPPCTAHRAGALCSCSSVFFAHFMGGGDNPVMVLALHPKPGGHFLKYLPPKPRVGLGSEQGAPPAPASGGFALLQAPRGAPARSPWGLRTPCPSPPPSPKPSTRTSKGPTPASRCRPGGPGARLGGVPAQKRGGCHLPVLHFEPPCFLPWVSVPGAAGAS